jgi:thiol-disulfide isomerase/thioredoxin
MSRTALWALLAVASALAALLGYQLSETRRLLGEAYRAASHPQTGSWIPSIATSSLDGASVTLGRDGATQVLYFFTPECPYCQASAPDVRALHEILARERKQVEFIGVGGGTAADLAAEARLREFRFPIVPMTPKLADLLKARQVPLLVAVSPDGQILYSKVGAFSNKEDATPLMAALTRKDARPLAN